MSEIRVVQILTRFNVGGPARIVLDAQPYLADLGITSWLVGGAVRTDERDLADMLEIRDVERLPQLGRAMRPHADLAAFFHLRRLLRGRRPHVVHTHMAKAGTLGRAAAVAAGVPIRVHTYHGHTLTGYWGRWGSGFVGATEGFLARVTTALVAVSPQVRDDLLSRGVGRPDRFRVLDVGLDLRRYAATGRRAGPLRDSLGMGPGDQAVGFAGRLVRVKGVELFLRAVGPMLSARPNLHVLIAGDGPDRSLVEAASRLPGGERIHLLGWVVDMERLYEGLDVVVSSSLNEGTPLSLIEASAAGVPVVAARVGGVPDVVRDGENGILVPPGQAEALRAAVGRLLDQPGLATRLGEQGRHRAARYSALRYAEGLAGLYRELCAAGQRSREHV